MRVVRNSVIADTVYSLALYLLYSPLSESLATRYFLGPVIPRAIVAKLPKVVQFSGADVPGNCRSAKLRFRLRMLWLNIRKIWFTRLFAQDHLFFSSQLISLKRYTLLEDAPGVYSFYRKVALVRPNRVEGLRNRLHEWLYWGPVGGRRLGTNFLCKSRLVSEMADLQSDLIAGRPHELINLNDLWKNASSQKRAYLREVLDVSNDMLVTPIETLVLSQPIQADCRMTDDEVVSVWSPYMMGKCVVVKRHPRDHFDYRAYFPNVEYLECPAPLQILCAMGLKVKKAITITSSAVSAFSSETEVIRLGADIHPKIAATYKAV